MTTAFIVQVIIGSKTLYVGPGGKIRTMPHFFIGAPRVKKILQDTNPGYSDYRYDSKRHAVTTSIIVTENIELGIQRTRATVLRPDEFLQRDFKKTGLSIPNNKNAIYMIQLATDLQLAAQADPVYVKRVGQGRARPKFGHQWQSAGHLRSHITANLSRLAQFGTYRGAKVVEIEMQPDGFTPKKVKTYPIVDFYCASNASRKQYEDRHGNYTPTPERA